MKKLQQSSEYIVMAMRKRVLVQLRLPVHEGKIALRPQILGACNYDGKTTIGYPCLIEYVCKIIERVVS